MLTRTQYLTVRADEGCQGKGEAVPVYHVMKMYGGVYVQLQILLFSALKRGLH
jgi:hypothetical protein